MRVRQGIAVFYSAAPLLRKALQDPAPYVRAMAADALARYGTPGDLPAALDVLAELVPADKNGVFVSLRALRTIFLLGEKVRPVWPKIKDAPVIDKTAPARVQEYPGRVMAKLRQSFRGELQQNSSLAVTFPYAAIMSSSSRCVRQDGIGSTRVRSKRSSAAAHVPR